MKNELQAETAADSSTTDSILPSALLAQTPVLAAVLSRRDYPCILCSCPKCGAIFMASALNEKYHNDNDANRELLNDLANYASQGYNISVKNSDEFKLDYCNHIATTLL